MAYCSNCGAYLPDGETVCVACGAVAGSAASQSGAAQTAYQGHTSSAPSSDELRRQLEEKQKKQQEQSRAWAKQAYEEFKSSSSHSASSSSSSAGSRPYSEEKANEKSKKTLGKVLAFLSYVSVGCFLPFIITPDDEFAKFHGKQGILLFVMSVIIDILGGIKSIAFVLGAFRLYLMYVGIKNVFCDRMEKLPYIGKYADKF